MRSIGTPTWVAMRRFSRTVRLGKIPRPSGTVQMPRRARSSADDRVTGGALEAHLAARSAPGCRRRR